MVEAEGCAQGMQDSAPRGRTWLDGRLVACVVIAGIAVAPLDAVTSALAEYDGVVFNVVILMFCVASVIGTRVVLRCGELPANDELFDLPESAVPYLNRGDLSPTIEWLGARNARRS